MTNFTCPLAYNNCRLSCRFFYFLMFIAVQLLGLITEISHYNSIQGHNLKVFFFFGCCLIVFICSFFSSFFRQKYLLLLNSLLILTNINILYNIYINKFTLHSVILLLIMVFVITLRTILSQKILIIYSISFLLNIIIINIFEKTTYQDFLAIVITFATISIANIICLGTKTRVINKSILSEQKLTTLCQSLNEGLVLYELIVNEKGLPVNYRFLEINPAFERLTGLKKENIVGKTAREIFPDINNYVLETYGQVALKKVCKTFVDYSKQLDKYYETIAYPSDGNQFVVLLMDITERIKYQDELKAAKKNAEATIQAKSKFITSISHELRTPMNGILGMIQLMELYNIDNELVELINNMKSECMKMIKTINNILDYVSKEDIDVKCEAIQVNELLDKIIAQFEQDIKSKSLEIVKYIEPINHAIYSDKEKLEKILTQLIDNAIKYTDKGEISISAYKLENYIDENKCYYKFTIKDSGPGIPSDIVSDIFNGFYQGDNTLTKEHNGLGLGLSTCQSLSEKLGGKIQVRSNINQGSIFTFVCPMRLTFMED